MSKKVFVIVPKITEPVVCLFINYPNTNITGRVIDNCNGNSWCECVKIGIIYYIYGNILRIYNEWVRVDSFSRIGSFTLVAKLSGAIMSSLQDIKRKITVANK